MTRSLRVSRAVAARLSVTAHRQLSRPHGHPHLAAYQCPVCLHPGVPADDETSVIVWSATPMDLVRLAHSECTRSMVIETGRGASNWAEPTNLRDLLAIDAFGVVHGGHPVILAGPTQQGALLTTKTLGHRAAVLTAARHELGFGLLEDRTAAAPASPSRIAFHDDILLVRAPPLLPGQPAADVLAGTLHRADEWPEPGVSVDVFLGYFEVDALDDPERGVDAAFARGPVIAGHCRIDRP
jgi:hypothetical protein